MFIFGFLVGVAICAVIFIVFAKNNQNKINQARNVLIGVYEKADAAVKQELDKINFLK